MNDNKFFDMDLDEPIVQEGSVRDPLMFYDDDEVVQEADEDIELDTAETAEEPAVEEPTEDVKENPTDVKTINVVPLEKVGDVSFGMTRDEVRNIFGDASEFNKSSLSKNTTDDFGFCHVFYNDDKCEAVEIFNTAKVMLDDTSVFDSDVNTIRDLFPDAEESPDGFISKGMSVGVYAPDNQIQSILFGCKGYYDSTSSTVEDLSNEEPSTEEVPEEVESTDDIAVEEEPDGSTEVTEDIETTEEPAVEEEPAEETPAETEEPSTEDEPTLESFVQEDGEVSDEQTVGEAIEAENETPDTGSTTTSDDFDFSLDLDLSSTDDALEGSTTPEGDDLKDFGTDTSDVQNDYDPKEIEILNKLIAAEADAINDYFDASKDSHDSNARRLYSDIGREERFHMEQLMYQKSAFTGEKYEPRDPEVKKEFEELLQLGMDDHTAMQTAIDKRSMETTTDSVDEMDFEILEYAANNSLTMLHQAEIILEASMYAYYHRADNTAKQYGVILEAYFQEEVVNTARAPKELKGTPNPFALLLKAFKAALKGLSSLTANIRESSERSRINRHARLEWIKKNGITGLFKSGKYFYFYNDTDAAFNMVIPVQYVDLLYRLSVDIGKKCGVTVTEQGYHGTIKNPIKYGSIEDGMAKIRSLNMTKTKVIVTDKNKDALINEFFGYSDKKINVKVWNEEANRAIYESNNVYNKLMCFAVITAKYSQVTDQILEVMQGLQGNMNSIYYKDRNAYNKYVGYMETIVKTYMSITKAATSDLTEMLSLDKEGIKDVTASRDAGNKLPEGAEDRRTSGALGNNRANKQYAKTKK